MEKMRRLEEIFCRFPGIGPRQARRFVYYLLSRSQSQINEFIKTLTELKSQSSECNLCHRLFIINESTINNTDRLCNVCKDNSRDKSLLLLVARDSDFESIDKSGAYKGLYFILGGTIPVLDKEPEKRIRLEILLERVSNWSGLKEIILSLNTTPEGENTADIIKEALKKIINKDTKITVLGRGLSTGSELEYADSETIKNALKNRN